MQKGVKAYNRLMFHLAMEYNTIGTDYTESPEMRNEWNLRDMVAEVKYILDLYNDPDSQYYQDAQNDEEYFEVWKRDKHLMQQFISKYKNDAMKMSCNYGHCSRYD